MYLWMASFENKKLDREKRKETFLKKPFYTAFSDKTYYTFTTQ